MATISDLNPSVTANYTEKKGGCYTGPRVVLKPLVTDKLIEAEDFVADDEVIAQAKLLGSSYSAAKFNRQYAYFNMLHKLLGDATELNDESDNCDDADDSEDIEEDVEDSQTISDQFKSVRGTYKKGNDYRDYRISNYARSISVNVICQYFLSDSTKDKVVQAVRNRGIHKVLEQISESFAVPSGAGMHAEREKLIRLLGLIQSCVNSANNTDILKVLKNYSANNESVFNTVKEFKGISDEFKSSNGDKVKEFVFAAMLDKLIKHFNADECTRVFQDIDNGLEAFSFLGMSRDSEEILKSYKSFYAEDYLYNVMVTVKTTFTVADVSKQLRVYATPEYLRLHDLNKKVVSYNLAVTYGSYALGVKDYFRAMNDERFIHIEKPDMPMEEINDIAKQITQKMQYKGCTCFVCSYDDFKEQEEFNGLDYTQFLMKIIRERVYDNENLMRYTISQSDAVTLGGVTLRATEEYFTIDVSIWVMPEFRNIRLAKETLYILAKGLRESEKAAFMRFSVSKANKAMIHILEDFGATKKDNLSSAETDVYELNVIEVASKTFNEAAHIVTINSNTLQKV